jgi:hypothetical protein
MIATSHSLDQSPRCTLLIQDPWVSCCALVPGVLCFLRVLPRVLDGRVGRGCHVRPWGKQSRSTPPGPGALGQCAIGDKMTGRTRGGRTLCVWVCVCGWVFPVRVLGEGQVARPLLGSKRTHQPPTDELGKEC